MNEIRRTTVFRHGETVAVEIPQDFGLVAGEVTIRRDGDHLIIDAAKSTPKTFREMLDQMETIDVEWPDVDEGLLPPDDVKL